MDHMSAAYINPEIIAWGLKRAGLDISQIATKAMPIERIRAWMSGDYPPTELQAEKLAGKLRLPYLVLFLDNPPDIDTIPLPDLRTVTGSKPVVPSIDFLDTVNASLLRQDWYREYQEANKAARLPFVGKFSTSSPVKTVAEDMRNVLGLSEDFRRACATWKEFLREFIRQAENAGILVMRNGIVEHSTRRTLKVSEFRGFASSDELAPLVFINDRDARAAQIFTLAHELAHIWIGVSGISNSSLEPKQTNHAAIERFCNQVAAELLVPEIEARKLWSASTTLSVNVQRITHHFRVSTLMALLRAYELGFTDWAQYQTASSAEWDRIRAEEEARKKKEAEAQKKQRGDFWATFKLRSSELFTHALADGIRRELASYSEASALLGVNLCTVEEFLRKETV